jgi:putative transcriptional regulator
MPMLLLPKRPALPAFFARGDSRGCHRYNAGMVSLDLTHHFLIAMPGMADPHFAGTLTYVCEHNDDGALGIVVDRPTDMTMGALFKQINIDLEAADLAERPVMFGGPVQTDRGFRAASAVRQVAVEPGGARGRLADHLARHPRGLRRRAGPAGDDRQPRLLLGWSRRPARAGEVAANAWLSVQADPADPVRRPVRRARRPRPGPARHRDRQPLEEAGHA